VVVAGIYRYITHGPGPGRDRDGVDDQDIFVGWNSEKCSKRDTTCYYFVFDFVSSLALGLWVGSLWAVKSIDDGTLQSSLVTI
jgi:hypothetical protein